MKKNFKKKNYFFSVIIPTEKKNYFLMKNLKYLNKQIFKNFEVIIGSDKDIKLNKKNYNFKISLINFNNKTYPGKKRNICAKKSLGIYLAFIDDDAYPSKHWLEESFKTIKKIQQTNFLLGGPGILPYKDSFFSKLVDLSFQSLVFLKSRLRYISLDKFNMTQLDDWPSVNLVISKFFFKKINGFNEFVWPGEDSKLCEKALNSNAKIFYISKMIVYHHRRVNFVKHLKQIFRYSFMRSKFFQANDKNSKKIIYILPSLFLIILSALFFYNFIFFLFLIIFSYLIFLFENIFKTNYSLIVRLLSPFFIKINLLIYSIGFAFGFISRKKHTNLGR
jgi:hypothetical protein